MSSSLIVTLLDTMIAWLGAEFKVIHPGNPAAQEKERAAEQLAKAALPKLANAELEFYRYPSMPASTISAEKVAQTLTAAAAQSSDVSLLFKKAGDRWGQVGRLTMDESRTRAKERAWYIISSILCKLAEDLRSEGHAMVEPSGDAKSTSRQSATVCGSGSIINLLVELIERLGSPEGPDSAPVEALFAAHQDNRDFMRIGRLLQALSRARQQ